LQHSLCEQHMATRLLYSQTIRWILQNLTL
jgi:hypothetical protein